MGERQHLNFLKVMHIEQFKKEYPYIKTVFASSLTSARMDSQIMSLIHHKPFLGLKEIKRYQNKNLQFILMTFIITEKSTCICKCKKLKNHFLINSCYS